MSETTNLGLPFIEASQAQKHVTHNEALLALDAVLQTGVIDRDLSTPPVSPTNGDAYIPAAGSTSDWAGNDLSIASWQDGAWQFYPPKIGWVVYVIDESIFTFWDGSEWVETGTAIEQLQNLSLLGVNTTADTGNKLAVSSDAVLFTHTGNGVQHKLNKNVANDTASVLFQTDWSGRAEIGTVGDDDFQFKVSPDGVSWNEAIHIDNNTGGVSFPNGVLQERRLPASVNEAGGTDWWGPGDHLTTSYHANSTLALVADRMYFAAFYVPRKLQLIGCFVSQSTASSTAGAVLRAGIFELGSPNSDNWDVGDRVADFGSQAADVAGNKVFDLATPQTIEPGWYLTALGVSGTNARTIYARWLTPALAQVFPYSSGGSARPRTAGPSAYLYENSCNSEITGGLPASWVKNPVSDITTTNHWVYQNVFPKWREI